MPGAVAPPSPDALRLRAFLTYATLAAAAGAALVLGLAAVYRHAGLLFLGLVLVASVAVLFWAWRHAGQARVPRAAMAICAPLWALSIFLALFVDVPLLNFTLLLVLSVMAVLPYVSQQALRRVITTAVLLAVVLTPLALLVRARELMPFSLKGQIVPSWLLAAILIVIVPTVIGLILLLLWQYRTQLAETLAQTQAANQALRESERLLAAKVQELQESRSRLVQVQEGVRREIAAYLHGRVQGRLLVLQSQLREPLRGTAALPVETRRLLAEVVEHMAELVEQDLSGLSRRLYPSLLRRGLVPALESLADQFEGSLAVAMALDERLAGLERTDRHLIPEPVRLAAYRIAEEAMANIVKHARATSATIRLELLASGVLRLTVEDDAQGFDVAAATGGLGLAAMQDYAAAAGGECVVRSAPGTGTQVIATLPVAGPVAAPREKAVTSG